MERGGSDGEQMTPDANLLYFLGSLSRVIPSFLYAIRLFSHPGVFLFYPPLKTLLQLMGRTT